MKEVRIVYFLAGVLVLEILLSAFAINEPSLMTANVEKFDTSKITQNQAVNVVNETWTLDSSTNFLEISMRKAFAFEYSAFDVGIPTNSRLVGTPTFHARLFALSPEDLEDYLVRAFVILVNDTHVIELNYYIGREPDHEIPDPDAPTSLHLYTSVSNSSNHWVTINRDIVEDLAVKNISVGTDGNWRISKLCIGGILYQKVGLVPLSILVDVDQTYLDLGGVKVYSDDASFTNITPILLIAGLCAFSFMILIAASRMLNERKVKMKLQNDGVLVKASLIFILQVALLVRLVFIDSAQFAADEAIYSYSSYLITKGVLPYKEVFMAHPPLHFYITAFFIQIFGLSYPSMRLLNIVIFLGTAIMTYLVSKVVLGKLNGKYSLLVVGLYALYPSWFIMNSISSSLENLLTFFSLLSVFFYVLYHKDNRRLYLMLSGFSAGFALLTTVRAVVLPMSVVTIHFIYMVWRGKLSQSLKDAFFFASGLAFPISCMLGLLATSNTLQYFILDVITYQLSLFRMTMNVRLWYLGWYLVSEWPLLLLAGIGLFLATKTIRQTGSIRVVIPGLVFFSSLFLFLCLGFFMHYLQFLGPFLSIASIFGIMKLQGRFKRSQRLSAINKTLIFTLLAVFGFFFYLVATNSYQISSMYFSKNPYDKIHYYIGNHIANITSPSDYIWSGDAAIGFFSKRMIVAPSADFRFIGCSDSIIGYDYGKDRGAEMIGYNDGFVTVEDFIQSWESKRVKVLVFIMNKGWIPYVDPLLWNGYREHLGAAEYVSSKYELREIVFGEDVSHIYYIWVRRE